MAVRPFAFGVRMRDKDRTVRIRNHDRNPRGYVVEDSRKGQPKQQREHASLTDAFRDLASTWRHRLN